MRPLNIEMENPHEIKLNMGYRGMCEIEIHFTDQNGIDHNRTLLIDVIGEKPTNLLLSIVGYKFNRVIYALSSEDD